VKSAVPVEPVPVCSKIGTTRDGDNLGLGEPVSPGLAAGFTVEPHDPNAESSIKAKIPATSVAAPLYACLPMAANTVVGFAAIGNHAKVQVTGSGARA
jgi:hypothetical protein